MTLPWVSNWLTSIRKRKIHGRISKSSWTWQPTHGIRTRADDYTNLEAAAEALHEEAAYFSTRRLVEMIDAYAEANNKKLLYILSYSAGKIAEAKEGRRRDQDFADFLKARKNPVIDLLEAHTEDHDENYKIGFNDYLKQFFVGHYNPLGNFFCAFATKDALVELLDPKPMAYSDDPSIMK